MFRDYTADFALATAYCVAERADLGQAVRVREVLERGDVQFFFRPIVQAAEAETYELGVQSFFLILSPRRGHHRRLRARNLNRSQPPPTGGGSTRPSVAWPLEL